MMTIRIAVAAGLLLAAEAPAFEVASVQPNKEIRSRVSMTVNPGGILYTAVSVIDCLQAAYGVKRYQISGPDWLPAERYNINARTAGATSEEVVKVMLKTLLADRFQLSLHREKKELPVFALQVGKNGAKLKPSDPKGSRSMTGGPGALVFTNTSMQDLSDFLSGVPAIARPVFDSTQLAGRFDFTLRLSAATGDAGTEETKRAVAEGEPSIFTDALDELGLKLDGQKATIDMLVVDRATKNPIED